MPVKKLPLCNDKAVADAAARTGESQKAVQATVGWLSAFIAGKVREGGLESVRVPRFGLFRAKLETVQFREGQRALPKTSYRVRGEDVIHPWDYTEANEETNEPQL